MSGPVEGAIRAGIRSGATLRTLARAVPFVVQELDDRRIVLLLGATRAWTPVSWQCLEGIPEFLRNRGWVVVGGMHSVEADPGTLDEYLKGWLKRHVANYVARVLAGAGVVEVDHGPPVRVRLRPGF